MSYVCVIRYIVMNKADKFDDTLQELARQAKVISHPARLAILKYLAGTKSCITGDITDYIPLSRTTVSQHLKELRKAGFIKGEIDGLKINYCLNVSNIARFYEMFEQFIKSVREAEVIC
jgi:DNA-binding transcriptional ArsR family regulator